MHKITTYIRQHKPITGYWALLVFALMAKLSLLAAFMAMIGTLWFLLNCLYPFKKFGIPTRAYAVTFFLGALAIFVSTVTENETGTFTPRPTAIIVTAPVSNKPVIVTKFRIAVQKISSNQIKISLDTDAPDEAILNLSASRYYNAIEKETKKQGEYVVPYFDEKLPVVDLKKGKVFDLNNVAWQARFEEENDPALGFTPTSISKTVVFSLNSIPNPSILGNNNERLTGAAVKENFGTKILGSEKQVTMPMNYSIKKPKKSGVRIGMNKQDVLESNWGKPSQKVTTKGIYGVQEQWIYSGNNYLYFEDGILTTIQN